MMGFCLSIQLALLLFFVVASTWQADVLSGKSRGWRVQRKPEGVQQNICICQLNNPRRLLASKKGKRFKPKFGAGKMLSRWSLSTEIPTTQTKVICVWPKLGGWYARANVTCARQNKRARRCQNQMLRVIYIRNCTNVHHRQSTKNVSCRSDGGKQVAEVCRWRGIHTHANH